MCVCRHNCIWFQASMIIMFAIFQWLQEFFPYFNKWEQSVTAKTGFEDQAKKMMIITRETFHGIKVNGKSMQLFVYMLQLQLYGFVVCGPGQVCIYHSGIHCALSERLCQDPLEKVFGCQLLRGGTNENPTVQEFFRNTHTFCIINSVSGNIKKGSCRGHKDKVLVKRTNHYLNSDMNTSNNCIMNICNN